jgi:myo-inositol-1(or 4)-monophosphatase
VWPDLDDLVQRVRRVAREEVMPRFRKTQRRYKPDGSIVTEADLAVQDRLSRELRECYPGIDLLGEEMDEARQRELVSGGDRRLWCLDPVDGTSNFATGLPFFSISLALLQGHEPVLGIVHDPTLGECFTAIKGQGAWLNGERLVCPRTDLPIGRCLAMVDFKRLEAALVTALANRPPYSSLRYTGSGALEWCWLAAGRFQLYLHGRQKLWDFAAGALILAEAGGVASTLDGEPIYAPGVLTRSVVAAPDARLFNEWRQAIASRRVV